MDDARIYHLIYLVLLLVVVIVLWRAPFDWKRLKGKGNRDRKRRKR